MMRLAAALRRRACLCVALCAVLGLQGTACAQALSVRDQRGVEVRLPQAAHRVITLLPSLTETVCMLGACERIVATDRWSDWPASVQALPKAGGLDDANLELIVAAKPDLVLAARSTRVSARLQALGVPVAVYEAQNLAEMEQVLRDVGRLLGVTTAGPVWQAMQAEFQAAVALVPLAARGKTVYFEVESSPYAAGASSFIGETLSRLGARNIVPASLGPFPKLNPEFVVQADPDLIIVSAAHAGDLAGRPGWSRLRALRHGRVCAVPAADYDVVVRPGPRMGVAALTLARCLALAAPAPPPSAASAPGARP